ncbi:ABC transporter ATP-binding protein [Schleiferiaceae bacterium]|nr:ABC transporter ATP-binding protein [Schleiferiaceae bacterium]
MGDTLSYFLENAVCQYKNSQYPVLEISSLKIKSGDIVFFVGASGVGKSTLLETLGLMNNTIVNQPKTKFLFDNGSFDLMNLWKKSESEISTFRKKHFSFVFQSTNLFNNLSALQNVCLAQIVRGRTESESKINAVRMLKKVFDEKKDNEALTEIVNGKNASLFSGGQRQRLAFVRAAVADYNVLLADEPTGNLDWKNATKLMRELSAEIKTMNKTAIVVTHDISLAMEYGDQVVLLSKNTDANSNIKGRITGKDTFVKSDINWVNTLGEVIDNEGLLHYLKDQL